MARCDLCVKFDDCPFRYDIGSYCCAFERKPMTNGDKIRAMTDEELDRFLSGVHNNIGSGRAQIAVWNNNDRPIRIWRTGWLDWLKQEATDEH